MPKKHPTEVRDRAVRMTLDRVKDYPSMWAAYRDLAPKLNIGAETLRKWVTQAQADAGERTGSTTGELEEIKRLKRENRDLRETNDILKAAAQSIINESEAYGRYSRGVQLKPVTVLGLLINLGAAIVIAGAIASAFLFGSTHIWLIVLAVALGAVAVGYDFAIFVARRNAKS